MLEKEEPQEEYIVTPSDVYNAHNLYSGNGYADSIGEFYKSLEHIVRCKDCKHYFDDADDIYYAYQVPVCMYFADHDGYNAPCVKPDGFCSWGEAKQ